MASERTEQVSEQAASAAEGEGASASSRPPRPMPPRVGRSASLKSEKGTTTIADTVVEKVAGIATREVGGVYDMGSGTTRAMGAVTQRVGLADERAQGVSVEVGEREAAVDLTIVVEYGESIPQVAEQVRENVISRVEGITGLSVTEVNVAVNDLHFPGDDAGQSARVS